MLACTEVKKESKIDGENKRFVRGVAESSKWEDYWVRENNRAED